MEKIDSPPKSYVLKQQEILIQGTIEKYSNAEVVQESSLGKREAGNSIGQNPFISSYLLFFVKQKPQLHVHAHARMHTK